MQPLQPAQPGTIEEAISNVSPAGQSADQENHRYGQRPPIKKSFGNESLGYGGPNSQGHHAKPNPTKSLQDEAAASENQGIETTPQTKMRTYNCEGNAEHTDPDGTTSNEPKDQEALTKEQRTEKPATMGQTSPPSIEDRTPQSNDNNRYATSLRSTPTIPRQITPHEPTEEHKKAHNEKST